MASSSPSPSSFYNADKPSRLFLDPRRRLLWRNQYATAALVCSSMMTTTAMALFSIRGGANHQSMSTSSTTSTNRILHTTIVHRHGDRTPITPLRDEDYWKSTLPSIHTLQELANGTTLQRKETTKKKHTAQGRGPFGKLTQLGLDQMMQVGLQLQQEESLRGISVQDIRVISTDFPRTIQSVQALLKGLLPNNAQDVTIDCRHTNWMIPDPQPRNSPEQVELEGTLIRRPHLQQKEEEMHPLAVKCTKALLPFLATDAFDINMGIDNTADDDAKQKVLPWAQLAEITKCLQVRNQLPTEITVQDQQALSDHLAWRWFQSLRDKRLAHLAMGKFASEIIHGMRQNNKLTIYSCHDSSLIGLICAFGLDNPSVWPEYASYLKIDLLETSNGAEKVVQFSLNGERLRWMHNGLDEIPLKALQQYIDSAGEKE